MRLLMQADMPIGVQHPQPGRLRRDIKKALSSKIETLTSSFAKSDPKRLGKCRYALNALGCLSIKTTASAFPAKAVRLGDGLKERRLTRSVFAHEKTYPGTNL